MSNFIDASVAKRLDITVKQNQTFDPILTFTDENNDPINLSGSTIKLSVRSNDSCNSSCGCIGDTPFDAIYKQDFYGSISGLGNNIVSFNDIIRLSEGVYKYDLLILFNDETQKYFLTGSFRVKRSYTNIPV